MPKTNKLLRFKSLLLPFVLMAMLSLFLASCKENTEEKPVYFKPPPAKLDATCAWLDNHDNYLKPDYKSVFYTYYQQKIDAKKYDDAAKAMKIVSTSNDYFESYDDRFFNTLIDFKNRYLSLAQPVNVAFIYISIGDYYSDKGNFKEAIKNYSAILHNKVNDYNAANNIGEAYRSISWCYHCIGNPKKALENNYKALEYFKMLDQKHILGGVYSNFSNIYISTRDFDKAIESLDSSIWYFKTSEKEINNIYIALYNKITIYEKAGRYEEMYALIDSVYHAFRASGINDPSIEISINGYYSDKLIHEGKIAESKRILDELKPKVKELHSDVIALEYNVILANYEIASHHGAQNLDLIRGVIPTMLENRYFTSLNDCYDVLISDALARKDYKDAFYYEIENSKIKDSIGSNEMKHKVVDLDKKYQTAKKEHEIILHKKTILNNNIIIALLVTALIFTVIAFSFRQKKKKLEIEKKTARLYTRQLLEKTEEDRKRIAGDLHDSVSHELLTLKNSIEERTESTNKKIDAIINDVRSISRNLHPIMFDKVGLKSTVNQMVERVQAVNNFLVTAEIDYDGSLSASTELQIYRIIQEALSNIIKYADAFAAKITISETKNSIHVEIKDNGKGFDVTSVLQEQDAFGLHNIIERSRAIGGEAKITSDKNGTVIHIEIKKTP